MSGIPVGRCMHCGHAWHPAPTTCPACHGPVGPALLPGSGRVVSWTRISRPPEGFPAPQCIVLVALDDPEGPEPPAAIASASEAALETGRAVTVVPQEDGRLLARPH